MLLGLISMHSFLEYWRKILLTMDEDISQIMKDLGFASVAYKKCFKTNEELIHEIKILKKEILKSREAENIQNNSLFMSRKLISEQQAIISKLVSVKEELKLCNDVSATKSKQIEELQEEKFVLFTTYQKEQEDLVRNHKENLEIFHNEYESEVHMLKRQFEIALSESVNQIKELSIQMEQIQTKKDEQMNSLVVEYENQLQQAHAHSLQMRDEFKILHDKNRANIAIYKKMCNNNSSLQQNIEVKPTVKVKTVKRKLFNKYTEFIPNE
ncbi:uncharacterized protein LOC143923229 isoform X2 [Arctopsyche grandis]|uniref:uncharacterized protein LOC143923229 isoform X2 n=1 Tax=Arctopsyche grandis TaxID=121162 RepID=UPI00406D97F5